MLADNYQELARTTATYPDQFKILYPLLGLTGEAGEVAGKFSKIIRDQDVKITEENKEALILEAGDVLWFIAILAQDLGYSLSEVMIKNLQKLQSRKERGTLSGSGDSR